MTDAVACEFCGETFAEGGTDLPFHWYCEHLAELDDEQFRAASVEYRTRLLESIDVDVPVTIPRDTWEDVVAFDTDGADPADVTPGDISKDTLIDLVVPRFEVGEVRLDGGDVALRNEHDPVVIGHIEDTPCWT